VANKKILITGYTGFLGKRVIDLMGKKYDIYCLIRKLKHTKFMQKSGNIHFLCALDETGQLSSYIKEIYACIHLAAETRSSNKKKNYVSNVLLTKKVIKLCRECKAKKIIFTSSINTRFNKLEVYSKSKLEAENFIKQSGLNYIIFVPTLIYGKGDKRLTKTVNLVKKFPIIPIIGDCMAKMQPVFVDDVAVAIIKSLESNINNKVYYLGGPDSFTFNKFIGIIMKRLNIRKTQVHIPFSLVYYPAKLLSLLSDKLLINPKQILSVSQNQNGHIEKAKRDLKYNPTYFHEGLGNILTDLK